MNRVLDILVLEDEGPAGEKLLRLILAQHPQAKITWYRSVSEAIGLLQQKPVLDLIFSDIELLDGNVFNVFSKVTPPCPIIFCTAYDSYYVDAFKTNGIAYLLKPYTVDEFDAAWEKYILLYLKNDQSSAIDALLQTVATLKKGSPPAIKSSFTVKKKEGVFLLKIEEIVYFTAQGDFVCVIDRSGKKSILDYTLTQIEQQLDPKQFFKINRSEIVNASCILKFEPYIKNRLAIHLSTSGTVLFTSNSRTPSFRTWLSNL